MKTSTRLSLILLTFAVVLGAQPLRGESNPEQSLRAGFENPPRSARPWVYWFWNNGNVTEDGIKADLAAMERVGIGGVIIMDVLERFSPPAGDADYMSPKWQKLAKLALDEAKRLKIEVNMTNGPGWCGSSGPWITPELSMQKLVSSSVEVKGGHRFSGNLPEPPDPEKARKTSLEAPSSMSPTTRMPPFSPIPRDRESLTQVKSLISRIVSIPPGG